MIFILIILSINLLISYSRFRQAKYLFFLTSILHLSLYLLTSQYSVDYLNYLRSWDKVFEPRNVYIIENDFIFYSIIRLLRSLDFQYISLPIFSLLLSVYSINTLSKTFKKATPIIFSSLIFPLLTYLSFHNLRQSISISFFIICISLLFSNNSNSFKKYKIIIFSFLALFSHFTLSIYFLMFFIFYFFGDYLINIKSNINKINLKIKKSQIILFITSIIATLSLIFFSRTVISEYLMKLIWYSTINSDSKYSASSALLFGIFCSILSIVAIYSFKRSNIWDLLLKSEKSFVLINVFSLIQLPLSLVASTISMRISFYSLLVSVISIAILNKYIHLNIFRLRLYNYYINIFYLGLLSLAPSLLTYRSLLPF